MALSLDYRAHSEIGLIRSNNQDSAYTSPSMLIVADGMGGAAAGDLASAIAIRELAMLDEVNRDPDTRLDNDELLDSLHEAITRANTELSNQIVFDPSLNGMGTTVCGVAFSGDHYGLVHIGDSRGYLLRDGAFSRLTKDHSYVQSLVDQGKITEDEAAEHPHRSLLLRVLNGQAVYIPDYELLEAHRGDRLLFCSDGLCGLVSDERIEQILRSTPDLDQVMTTLTGAAYCGGGSDNITIIVADVVEQTIALEAAEPTIYGAAAQVEIPQTPFPRTPQTPNRTEIASAPARAAIDSEAVDPATVCPEEAADFEAIRYQPREVGRVRRWWPVVLGLFTVLALVVLVIVGARGYLAHQYYLGPGEQTTAEMVAIYQGSPEAIFGRSFSSLIETTEIPLGDLPPYYAGLLRDQQLRYDSEQAARAEIAHLNQLAERCRAQRAANQHGPTATPQASSASPAPPSPTPGASATPRPDLEECG